MSWKSPFVILALLSATPLPAAPPTYVLDKANAISMNCDIRDYGMLSGLHNWTPPKALSFGAGSKFTGQWNGPRDLSGKVVLQIDERDLHLYAEIMDDQPFATTDKSRPWTRDAVELFLSLRPHPESSTLAEGDAQLQLRPGDGKGEAPSVLILSTGADGSKRQIPATGCQIVVKEREITVGADSGKGLVMEAKIPLALFPAYQRNKLGYIGFSLFVVDLDAEGKLNKCLIGGTPEAFKSTENYITGFLYAPREIVERVVDIGHGARQASAPKANAGGKDVKIWDMALAPRRELPGRESLCLSGVWGVQTFAAKPDKLDDAKWKYLLLPLDPHFFQGGEAPCFELRDGALVSASLADDLKGQRYRFHCRDFSLPASWDGKNVFLDIEECGVSVKCKYYLDGKLVSGKGEVESQLFDLGKLTGGRTYQLVIEARAANPDVRVIALGDVWLHGVSGTAAFERCVVATSVKDKTVAIDVRLVGAPPEGATLAATISAWPQGAKALDIPAMPLRACRVADGVYRLKAVWPGPKLWSPEHPWLYTARVTLSGDDAIERRFGFRELEVSGKELLLNGVPFHVKAMHGGYYANDFADLAHLKKLGFNTLVSFCDPFPDYYLNWMDELGLMGILHIAPALTNYNFGVFDRSPARKEWLARHAGHPSTLLWLANLNVIGYEAGWCHWNYCVLGTDYFPVKSKDGALALAQNREIDAWFQEADPATPVVDYCSGNQGKVASTMSHADFGLPLQEASGFADSWAKSGPRPLIAMEAWVMPTGFNLDLRRGRYKNAMPKFETREEADVNLTVEELSQYLGDQAYELADPVRCFPYADDRPSACRNAWDLPLNECLSPSGNFYVWQPLAQAEAVLAALAMREQARGDRGNGLTGRNYFLNRSIYPDDPIILAKGNLLAATPLDKWYAPLNEIKSQRDKMRCGPEGGRLSTLPLANWDAKADYKTIAIRKIPFASYFRDATDPVLVFVGGGPDAGQFRNKDHAFSSGEKVVKHIVAVNDRETPVTLKVDWTAGPDVAKGSNVIEVPAGGVVKTPVEFTVPELAAKRDCVLKAGSDEFKLELYPALKPAGLKVYCFDPRGLTAATLRRLGVEVETPSLLERLFWGMPSDATLVVGRESLDAFLDAHSPEEITEKVDKGLKLLVMEQGLDSVLGPVAKELRLRNQFVKHPAHPALAGFADKDFAQWRGESSLTPARPAWEAPTEYTEYNNHQMFGKWGNEGIVCTLPLRRPQHGNSRSLLAGGFDQEWAGLIECQRGAGALILCQLDIDGRSQADPVADRLLLGLLRYLAAYQAPAWGAVAYAGGEGALNWLRRLKPDFTADAAAAKLLVVGPGGDDALKRRWLDERVKAEGRTMLVLWPESSADLKWLGMDVVVAKAAEHDKQYYKACLSDSDKAEFFLRGVNDEDLFYRFRRGEIPLVAKAPGRILAGGLFADIPAGKGRVLLCQLNPAWHEGERSFGKTIRTLATILTDYDVALDQPFRLAAPFNELSQRLWKFKTDPGCVGDAAGWAKPGFDDSAWGLLKTGASWESQGVTEVNPQLSNPPNTSFNGVGWYRLKVDVPKEYLGFDLFLEIGSIAGEDEAWFNGAPIGHTGPKDGVSNYHRKCPRSYRIPAGIIKESGNVIAVKANCPGGVGGISKWPVRLSSEAMALPSIPMPMEKDRKFGDPYRFVMW